ncbi:MAG: copper amine oxidase N-terminal domain-containing protein [Firmicutes bacterium]|nr:copper amine oxidase N-terminal domain-containing protein [Bacillota bacterium]
MACQEKKQIFCCFSLFSTILVLFLIMVLVPPSGACASEVAARVDWQFRDNVYGAHPTDLVLLDNGNLLMVLNGSSHSRILEVSRDGRIVWSYEGIAANSARRLPNGNTLVADSGAPGYPFFPRVAEIAPGGEIVWEKRFSSRSRAPLMAEPLADGTILVTVRDRVFQLLKEGGEGFSISRAQLFSGQGRDFFGSDALQLVSARQLDSGNLLVIGQQIRGQGSVVETTTAGQVVARFTGLEQPVDALRLSDGGTLILDLGSCQVLDYAPSGELRAIRSYRPVISELPVLNQWRGFLLPSRHAFISLIFTNTQSLVMEINDQLPRVFVDGVEVPLVRGPFMANSRLMVPLQEICKAAGINLTWGEKDRSWTAQRGNVSLTLFENRQEYLLGGKSWTFPAFPILSGKELYIPIGLLQEAFGMNVRWNAAARTAEISTTAY